MVNPYQQVARQWPKKVKDKCFDLFMQGYSAPEISKATGVSPNTIYNWSWETEGESWGAIRRDTVTDYRARAEHLATTALYGIDKCVRIADKLLEHTETRVDSQDASEGPSKVTKELSELLPIYKTTADVLLRLFGK